MVIISILILIAYYYFQDREREPIVKILEAFFIGIAIVFQVNYLQEKLLGLSSSFIYKAFFVSAMVEELAKYLSIRLTIYRDKHFNECMDGIVYCVVLGLGFGLIEAFVLNDFSISRSITVIPMHSLVGAVMGYYLGLYKINKRRFDLIGATVFPVLLHGIYNYAVYIDNKILFATYFVGLWVIATFLLTTLKEGE